MKASDLFVRCLEAEGVTHIFGLPGEENADVMISLLDSKIKFVLCRHEQAAAFIADAYGRLTGKSGRGSVSGLSSFTKARLMARSPPAGRSGPEPRA